MKKILYCCLISLILIISGCSVNSTKEEGLSGYTEISYTNLLEKIEAEENFPLVIGSSECSACANYEITMNRFITKHQVEVFLIDLSKLNDAEYNKLVVDISFSGTPTTVFYEEGKLTSYFNRINESASMSVVEAYFRNNGYIE